MAWVRTAGRISELDGSRLDHEHGGHDRLEMANGPPVSVARKHQQLHDKGFRWSRSIEGKKESVMDPVVNGATAAWPINGLKVGVSPTKMKELPVANAAMMRVVVGLKISTMGRGIDLCTQASRRGLSDAEKWLNGNGSGEKRQTKSRLQQPTRRRRC